MFLHKIGDNEKRIESSLKLISGTKKMSELLRFMEEESAKIALNPQIEIMEVGLENRNFPGYLFCVEPEELIRRISVKCLNKGIFLKFKKDKERIIRDSSARLAISLFEKLKRIPDDYLATLYPRFMVHYISEMALRSQGKEFDFFGKKKPNVFYLPQTENALESLGIEKKTLKELILESEQKRSCFLVKKIFRRQEKKLQEKFFLEKLILFMLKAKCQSCDKEKSCPAKMKGNEIKSLIKKITKI